MYLSTLDIGGSSYIGKPSMGGALARGDGFRLTSQRFEYFRIFRITSPS